jgi:hypothetical protein
MSALRMVLWAFLLAIPSGLCRADVSQLRILLQSILAEQDDSRLLRDPPNIVQIGGII